MKFVDREGGLEEVADSFYTRDSTLLTMDEPNILMNTDNELDLEIEQRVEKKGPWKCKSCSKTFNCKAQIQIQVFQMFVASAAKHFLADLICNSIFLVFIQSCSHVIFVESQE